MEEDIKVLEALIEEHKKLGDTSEETRISQPLFKIIIKALENLIKGYKELEEYQHKVNEILNVDTDNLDTILIKNNQEGLKKCVTEFEKENQSYRDYFGTPPCYDNADYIPKSKVRELQKKYDKEIIKLEHKKIWNEPVDTIKKNRYTNYYNAYEELLQEGDK